jgi:hypothetical protein
MKTLVWFFMIFSVSNPHMKIGDPLILHVDMPAAQCEQAVLDNPSYRGPIGSLPGYSQVFETWCEDQWPETMDAEFRGRERVSGK